jgi:hypothetical protein
MNYGSPLTKDQRAKKEEPTEKPKPKPKGISKAVAKQLVLQTCEEHHCRWIERYLENLVATNCYPPKLKTNEAFSTLSECFTPTDALRILEDIRREFGLHFGHEVPKGEFDFLLAVLPDGCEKDLPYPM